jgi:hypothetical protein
MKNLRPKPLKTVIWGLLLLVIISSADINRAPKITDEKTILIVKEGDNGTEIINHRFGKNVQILEIGPASNPTVLKDKIIAKAKDNKRWAFVVSSGSAASDMIKNRKAISESLLGKASELPIFLAVSPNESTISANDVVNFVAEGGTLITTESTTENQEVRNAINSNRIEGSDKYINWLAKSAYPPTNTTTDKLWMLARVLSGTMSEKTLGIEDEPQDLEGRDALKNTSLPSETPTLEEIVLGVATPIDKKPKGGRPYGGKDINGGILTFPNWTTSEILRFQTDATRELFSRQIKNAELVGLIEVMAEAWDSLNSLPQEHSNLERWQEGGIVVRNQTSSNCNYYAHATALDALLINRGMKNPKISASSLERNGEIGWGSTRVVLSAVTKAPIKRGNGETTLITDLTIRSCNGISVTESYQDFPTWLYHKLYSRNELTKREWDILNLDLLKYEVSKGNPVILGCPFPDVKDFNKKYKQNSEAEIILRANDNYYSNLEGHSVVVVGYKQDPENPRETLFEVINSWGNKWGKEGRAWISSSFLNQWRASIGGYSLQ